MELRQLEYFVAVADERSFSRAAVRLNVVQSGVSAGVKTLERELGARLLERTSRSVTLTDVGAAFLPKARATLDAARDARDVIAEHRGGLRGLLRVGMLSSAASLIDVPALLGDFHDRYPAVDIQLSSSARGSRDLVEELISGRLDLSLVSLPGPVPPGITSSVLLSERLHLVVPAHHPLASRRGVALAGLAGELFIDFPRGWGIRTVVDRAFAEANLTRRVALEAVDMLDAAELVRHNLGVAILPRFATRDRRGLRLLGIAGVDLHWPVSVATSSTRSLSAPARALLARLPDYVQTPARTK